MTATNAIPSKFQPLAEALPSVDAWTDWFRRAEVPILADTADALEAMRNNEDDVDAHLIGEMVADDPLMTLKILAYAASHKTARRITDVETVIAAIVMLGVSPFFGTFGQQPTVEDRLADNPEALAGLYQVLRRAHRAARFAYAFAVHRTDLDAAVIYEAALLHDVAEMLLWCEAPPLALRMKEAQNKDPSLRSRTVQREVLGVELHNVQQALMRSWGLPALLIRITDEVHTSHPSVRSVMLAIRLARHTADGWDNPAVPDDITELSSHLNLSHHATLAFLNRLNI